MLAGGDPGRPASGVSLRVARFWQKLQPPYWVFTAFARYMAAHARDPLAARIAGGALYCTTAVAHTAGRGRAAEAMLRRVIARWPRLVAPRFVLAELLHAATDFRLREAETAALDALRLSPSDPALLLVLARIQVDLRRSGDASETVERLLAIDPENAAAWFEYGAILRNSYVRTGRAADAFARAGELAGSDAHLVEQLAWQFLHDLDHAKAAGYFERLFALDANARQDPQTMRRYAAALRGCGRREEARGLVDAALARCRALAAKAGRDEWEEVRREQALLLLEAGRRAEAEAALRSIRECDGAGPRYDRPEYLPSTVRRMARLADMVGSRDVLILLQGPSYADFIARMDAFADIDCAIATLSAFPPIEQSLTQIKRQVDILLITHPSSIRSWRAEFEEFLRRPARNLVLTSRYALSGLSELGIDETEFIVRHDERLLFAHHQHGPPLPGSPLHFETGNSLTLLLPLLLLGRPRRIFIFGADGGANPHFRKRPYFYYDDYDAGAPAQSFLSRPDVVSFRGLPDRLEEANRRFYIDAVEADHVLEAAMLSLAAVFDVPIPPIFNVCPHSSHRLFTRIGIEEALARLRSDLRGSESKGTRGLNASSSRRAGGRC
jgi:tetratricopeptide (TPR) repeat protein